MIDDDGVPCDALHVRWTEAYDCYECGHAVAPKAYAVFEVVHGRPLTAAEQEEAHRALINAFKTAYAPRMDELFRR